MRQDGRHFEAISETTSFLRYFNDLPDYRQAGKVDYPLPEVLLLILLAVLGGAEAFTDIARFGEKKLDLLRRFLPFANGTPYAVLFHGHSKLLPKMACFNVALSRPSYAAKNELFLTWEILV